jgi:hypothetical protein
MYGHKGMSGAYSKTKATKGKNPLKGKKMVRGPKDPKPSHKGYA